MIASALIYTHLAAFLGYGALALVLVLRGARSWLRTVFAWAALLTSAWGGAVALSGLGLLLPGIAECLAAISDGAWYSVALTVLYFIGQERTSWRLTALTTAIVVAVNGVFAARHLDAGSVLGIRLDWRLTSAIELCLGAILLENMMRNLDRDRFWSMKHFGIGLGAIILFRAFVLTPALLIGSVPEAASVAQPLLYLLVLPLFVVSAVRSPDLEIRVHASRTIVFHTAALIAAGIVLQGAAIAAYYLRSRGGDYGTVLAILVGFGSLAAVAVALASQTVRSRLTKFINENFFSYRYDYRREWQNFIRAVSKWTDDDVPLGVVRTLAELLDSTGGALWSWRESWNRFMPVARWSFEATLTPVGPNDPIIKLLSDEGCAFIDLRIPPKDVVLAEWRQRFPRAWLVVPFRYRSRLAGFALINPPRVERRLGWEEREIISLLALQLAAFLVQHETAQALADARQLEQFNKRFAFILHDTKNAVGQLSLLVRNVEAHGHDENFRKDMAVTLRNSVDKLQSLLLSLTGRTDQTATVSTTSGRVDLAGLISDFVEERRRRGQNIIYSGAAAPAHVRLPDTKAFLGVLEHVVTNALEATREGAAVVVRMTKAQGFVSVLVEDRGPGMAEQFISNNLFRPRKSTKATGYGIGAFQAREVMRELGGEIDIQSKVGEGTTVQLKLRELLAEPEVLRA